MKDMTLLKQYIRSIAKYPRITPDREIELALRIQKGDAVAKESLVNANLKLVVKISLELCKGCYPVMDVIQNGNLGLIKAAEKFDPEKGVRFSTYSAFWIKQSILRGFAKPLSGLSLSYRKEEVNKKVRYYLKDFISKEGKFPTLEDMVQDLKIKKRDALDGLLSFKNPSQYSESSDEVLESIHDNHYNPELVAENRALTEDVMTALDTLPNRESEIIKKRFGFEYQKKETLQSLGIKYAISAEAARQIERKVLAVMRCKFPSLAYYLYAA